MKGTYRTAITTLGVTAVVAAALALLPAHRTAPGAPQAGGPAVGGPFQQVRVYRTPGGGLMRTETVRWQGPGSLTIVTWSSNGQASAALPPWVAREFQNMMGEQRLLQAAMQRLMAAPPAPLSLSGPWVPMAPLSVRIWWPKAAPGAVPGSIPAQIPGHAPAPVVPTRTRRTVDI